MKNDPLFKLAAAAVLAGVFLSLIIPTHAFAFHPRTAALEVPVHTVAATV